MFGDQVCDFCFCRIIQRVIRRPHIGKFGVAAFAWDDARMQQRIAGADRAERRIGVPQLVGQRVHAPVIFPGAQLVLRVEIGDVAQLQPVAEAALLRLGHLPGERHLQLAEVAAELALLLVGDRLVVEHQHGVAGPCRPQSPRPRRATADG